MKRILLIVSFALSVYCSRAQTLVLSGMVKDTAIKELQLELLYGDQEYEVPTRVIPVARDGHFKQSLVLPYPVFAALKAGHAHQRLLLCPGRDLQVQIGKDSNNSITLSGNAAVENELVHNSILDTKPFFMQTAYTGITIHGWQDTIMNRVQQELAIININIDKCAIPAHLKKILHSEAIYAYQYNLYSFTANNLRFAKNRYKDTLLILAMQWQPTPDSIALVSGFYANKMMDTYFNYDNLIKIRRPGGGEDAKKERLVAFLQTPYDSLMAMCKMYGGRETINWLYALYHQPAALHDKVLFNAILFQTHFSTLNGARYFLQIMQEKYPHSHYLASAEVVVQQLSVAIQSYSDKGQTNLHTTGITTLSDLVKPYKGKVVYLDIWGTWCGPCLQEMQYVHALKQRFAGKDVVFVYLDKDEASEEGLWKEVIAKQKLAGEHYRLNAEEIKPIWQELQLAGAQAIQSYPTFVIFDREGKIVQANAERPSSGEKLYTQLDKLL